MGEFVSRRRNRARAIRVRRRGPGRYSPRRWRLRYSPLREMPRARAAASTLPSLVFKAALIISRSTRASAGTSLSVSATAISGARFPREARGAERRTLFRQRGRRDRAVGVGEGHHAPQFVIELTHVAWPRVEDQVLHRFLCQPEARLPELLSRARDEMVGQSWNLIATFAERRHRESDDIEAIEQVVPETSLLDELFEVGVG